MKILAIIPNMECPTSFWRAVGPLSYMRDLDVTYNDTDGTWPTLIGYDMVFLHRPSIPDHVDIMKRCRIMGIPTWIDYDDNLLKVAPSNPSSSHYNSPTTKSAILDCVKLADRVTVSTIPLKVALGNTDKIQVVRNAWDFKLFPYQPYTQQKVIVCRGSATHDEDILTHLEEIIRIHHDFPEYQWVFMGGINWQVMPHLDRKRVRVIKPTDPISYMHTLRQLSPEWFLVPLTDTNFNHCKSDIAWLEATYAGAACLGPDFVEWQSPGVTKYTKDCGLYDTFKNCRQTAPGMVESSRRYIELNRTLFDANIMRKP